VPLATSEGIDLRPGRTFFWVHNKLTLRKYDFISHGFDEQAADARKVHFVMNWIYDSRSQSQPQAGFGSRVRLSIQIGSFEHRSSSSCYDPNCPIGGDEKHLLSLPSK
jgi:hypothetical protein